MSTYPRRVIVQSIVSSRYAPGTRPVSWDARKVGFEVIQTTESEQIQLWSRGGQSTPAPGWQLLLTKPTEVNTNSDSPTTSTSAIEWTLYGVPPSAS